MMTSYVYYGLPFQVILNITQAQHALFEDIGEKLYSGKPIKFGYDFVKGNFFTTKNHVLRKGYRKITCLEKVIINLLSQSLNRTSGVSTTAP